MAAGKFTVLNVALPKIGNGGFDLDGDAFRLILCDSSQSITESFAGTSGAGLYADLTGELSTGSGYTAGGVALSNVTWTRSGAEVTLSADPATWSSLTATVKYGLIIKDGGSDDILGFFDMETLDPDGRLISGSDLIVNFTGGVFKLNRV